MSNTLSVTISVFVCESKFGWESNRIGNVFMLETKKKMIISVQQWMLDYDGHSVPR